mgnify:CR=1 FL=1
MINVIIPMAGAGKRFTDVGYTIPKPFIPVKGKPMVQAVVENLNIDGKHIFIIQKEHSVGGNLQTFLNAISPNCVIIEVDELTDGPACTALLAEQYINSQSIPNGKRVYILRPCLIHGKSNKGNLNLLFNFVSKGIPWPLGAFENQRSFCTISNLLFIINELIFRDDIDSGIYNVADDESLSTNSVISILSEAINRKPKILNVSKVFIKRIAILGDLFHLPLTTERLQKLTESYIVSNLKIKSALNKSLPFSVKDGLLDSFNRE